MLIFSVPFTGIIILSLFTTRDFFTVIVFVATIFVEFPLKSNTVADIVAVPALIPFTFPASSTVAFVVSLEVHLTLLFSISVGFIVYLLKCLILLPHLNHQIKLFLQQ